ncbi:hypothetical protein MBANPS3_012301, partial [Mucor bainieri]
AVRQFFDKTVKVFLHRYVALMSKANTPDSHLMAVLYFRPLQTYVRDYLTKGLPTLLTNGAIHIHTEPIPAEDTIRSFIAVLEDHATKLNPGIQTAHKAEKNRREAKASSKIRSRVDTTDSLSEPAPKRCAPKSRSTEATTYDSKLCSHCKRDPWTKAHDCPEQREFYRLRAERNRQDSQTNRTGTFSVRQQSFVEQISNPLDDQPFTVAQNPATGSVNIVIQRAAPRTHIHAELELHDDTREAGRLIVNLVAASNLIVDHDDMIETPTSLSPKYLSYQGNQSYFLCSMLHNTTKKQIMNDDNDILPENLYSPLSPFLFFGIPQATRTDRLWL